MMRKRRPIALLGISLLCVALVACGGGDDLFSPETVAPGSGEDRAPNFDDFDPTAGVQSPPTDAAPGEPADTPFEDRSEDRPVAPEDPAVILEAGSPANVPDAPRQIEPREGDIVYTVQPGDTIGLIAVQFGVTINAIIEANGLTNPDRIDIGQELIIPPQAADAGLETVPDDTAVPDRPAGFTAFADSALAWIDARQSVGDCIIPLFNQWGMPPVFGGDRCNLVDTNLDGYSSAAIIFTDPTPSDFSQISSDLVIFEPSGDDGTSFRVAYQLSATGPAFDIAVLHTRDINGDVWPDITFQEVDCGASRCVTILHVLSWDSDTQTYVDLAAGLIEIAGAASFDFSDRTGDGIADITIATAAASSPDAGPACGAGDLLYSAHSGTLQLIEADSSSSDSLICTIVPGNEAFAAGAYQDALAAYEEAVGNAALQTGEIPNERAELTAFAHLRQAIVLALQGNTAAAIAAAQLGATEEGLHARLANAFLSGYAGSNDISAGCATLNNEIAPLADQFRNFWSQFGYSAATAPGTEELCPF